MAARSFPEAGVWLLSCSLIPSFSLHSVKAAGGLKLMNSPVRLIWGIVFFALLLVYSAASFYVGFCPPGSDAGWSCSGGFGEFQVLEIDPQGRAQELRPGDK